jgi:hypothetical protein
VSLTYKEFWSELQNSIPNLSIFLSQRFINRAWRDIQDSRQWSFLKGEGLLYSPLLITTGTFSITQYSNIVTASASAITALTGLANPVITKRQIRFGSGSTPIYNIAVIHASFASNGILYLDRPYKETTSATSTYRLYRAYYGPPEITTVATNGTATTTETTDFLRFNDIYNPTNSRYFAALHLAREILDRRDPQRSTTGNIPYYLFAYKTDSNNQPMFEMWPHPLNAQAYPCSYQKRGTDFTSDTTTLPNVIPDELLMERALFYGCEWAAKNQNRYTELKGINWKLEQQGHKVTYSNISSRDPGLLEIAQRNDEEAYPQNTIIDRRSYNIYPLGSDDLMVYDNITP